MKKTDGVQDFKREKSLRIGLLIASSLAILSLSVFIYSTTTQGAASVGGSSTSGVSGLSVSTWAIPIIVFSTVGITLMLFAFLREAFKHIHSSNKQLIEA